MNTEKNQKPISMEKNLYVWLAVAIIVAVVTLVAYFGFFNYLNSQISKNSSDWGSFGEFFNGIVSPFLNFVMIIAVIRTVELTRIMISEQRKQMIQNNNLMRVGTAIQGVTSMMNYHETRYLRFEKSNKNLEEKIKFEQNEIGISEDPRFGETTKARIQTLNASISQRESKIEENKKQMSAHSKISGECTNAIRTLMESTSENAEQNILYAGKLIDDAVVKHLHPLKKEVH